MKLSFASKGIEELRLRHNVEVNALTGAAAVSVPLPLTPGRGGFGPSLALQYGSSGGNSTYGVGWSLAGLSSIGINTRDGLAQYNGEDTFIFNGSDELVPTLDSTTSRPQVERRGDYWVQYYRSKIERGYLRFEQWVHSESRRSHWQVRSGDNSVSIYGQAADNATRIADPDEPERTFLWLLEAQYDRSGNAILYDYVPENATNVDRNQSFEHDRLLNSSGFAQRYLKRIRYGNTRPLQVDEPIPPENRWLFGVVFDYGDHLDEPLPSYQETLAWSARQDAHSTYRPGFEVRTYRLCRRVLMFHNFPELGVEPALVGATTLNHREDPAGTILESIHYTAYRHDTEPWGQSQKSLPPLRFEYTSPEVSQSFQPIPGETQENLPQGLSGIQYRWVDLYGEGLPGILTETSQAWYYKPNQGDGVLGQQERVIEKPSLQPGTYTLSDFDQNGNLNLVVVQGRQAGFYEFDRDRDHWKSFRPFPTAPQIDLMGSQAQWIDLNGDGRADILISHQDRFVWYPSEGKDGFGAPIEIAKPQIAGMGQPTQVAENPNLDFFLADMNGDGLLDLVRILNGRVEYWPQIGNGRFGDSILMEDAPILDFNSEFDASRIRFVDLDGSGTSDFLYLGRGEVRYWVNASGNRFIEGGQLATLPYLDNLAAVQVLDFLGDGTPCLVWSSALPGNSHAPLQYLQLTSGIRPRLLLSVNNSMGQETRLTYSLSSQHYLRDKRQGREWIAKLPSHSTVVDQREVIDHISGSRMVSRYEYHDGYFDSEERVFRGFGLVDQYDAEVFVGAGETPEHYTNPACVRTWYHNGAFGWDTRRFEQFYQGDTEQDFLPRDTVEDLATLKADEFEDAIRSLAGFPIRQEIYATNNAGNRNLHPYQVTQTAYRLRRLQASTEADDACFMAYQSEQLAYNYEQNPADPRITHALTLDVDDYGNPLEACQVAYPRRSTVADRLPMQERGLISASRNIVVNIDEPDRYETGIPIESQAFEVRNIQLSEEDIFQFDSLRAAVRDALTSLVPFHEAFAESSPTTPAPPQAKLLNWNQIFYWSEDITEVLAFNQVGQQMLPHHTESACFTEALINGIFDDRVTPALLTDEGRYLLRGGYWWQSSDTYHYLPAAGFYLPDRMEQLDGSMTRYTYDGPPDVPYYLTLRAVEDALGNRSEAEIDYYVIAPHRITDANGTIAEVYYDPLGVAIVSTSQGSVLDEAGTPRRYGQNLLVDYTPQPETTFEQILAEPDRFLQAASQFLYYELDSWESSGSPLRSLSLVREDLVHDSQGTVTPNSRIQIGVAYGDGFGRSLQSKQLVEAGPAIDREASGNVLVDDHGYPQKAEVVAPNQRWLVSGHVVYNNKQQPVRQYEPFFSTTVEFESDQALRRYGVSATAFYDAVGRQIRTELPNGTATRVEFTPWLIRNLDPNDTVQDSRYRVERETLPEESWERRALIRSLAHADTPTVVHLDPLGREVIQVETGGDSQPYRMTESRLDIQGNVREIIDARRLTAFTYRYDMLGRPLFQRGVDAGESWSLLDALDQPIHSWDGRGVHQRTEYDLLGRPTLTAIDGPLGERVTERMVYGDDPSIADAAARNLRSQLVQHFDQAGVQTVQQYTPEGTPLQTERHLATDYRTEPNWTEPSAVALDPDLRFETRVTYDALGRGRVQSLPDGTTRWMDYLLSGGVAQVRVSTADGELREVPFLGETVYNARGQREQAELGNGIEMTYTYDRETFRMSQMTSARPGNDTRPRRRVYQDIAYTYDPVGNLIHHVDRAQQSAAASPRVFQGLNVSSHCDFTYDAFYQLTRATGRVHQALMPHDYQRGLPESAMKNTQHLTLNNGAVVERYTRTYDYDLAGNIRQIGHVADSRDWTREMWVSTTSNRSLPATDLNNLLITEPESRFDANGNCLYMPHLRSVEWNYRNNISRVVMIDRSGEPASDPAEAPVSDVEYYVYGGDGMRLRKVQEKLIRRGDGTTPDQVETTEKIYLDGAEIKRVLRNGDPVLVRTTSHISDGTNRIAVLHQWQQDQRRTETDDISQKRIHYQLSNHLGSASMEVDEAGNVISYEEYFPFGGAAFIAGDNRREVKLKDYRYSGKERDEATGFYYYGYRYYVPWTGRWLSADPIGPEDGLNLYQFVRNNPVNLTDPNGLQSTAIAQNVRTEFQFLPESSIPESLRSGEEAQFFGIHSSGELEPIAPVNIRAWAVSQENPRIGIYDPQGEFRAGFTEAGLSQVREGVYEYFYYPTSGIGESSGVPDAELLDSTAVEGEQNPGSEGSSDTEKATPPHSGEGNGGNSISRSNGNSGSSDDETGGSTGRRSSGSRSGVNRETGQGLSAPSPRGRGQGAGVPGGSEGGIPGGTGSGSTSVERHPQDNQRGTTDPRAAVDGDPNGSLTGTVGPEEVHAEGGGGFNPNGSEEGTPGGTLTNGQTPEELEWWQTALIVVAVIAVSILTAGLLTAALTTVATVGTFALATETAAAIGVLSGLGAGLAGNAYSQLLTIGFGAQEEFDYGQLAFEGGVGAFTGGLGGYFTAARTASSAASGARTLTPRAILGRGARRFAAGAAEGGGVEVARQAIFEDEFDLGLVGVSAAIGGGAQAGVGGVLDYLSTRSTSSVSGAASSLGGRPDYPLNPNGMIRTEGEALDLLTRSGVFDPDDEFRIVFRDKVAGPRGESADAAYSPPRASFDPQRGEPVLTWDDFLTTTRGSDEGQVVIRISRGILNSDDRLIGSVAHELFELNGLRNILLESGGLPARRVQAEIDRLHLGAVEQERIAHGLASFFKSLFR